MADKNQAVSYLRVSGLGQVEGDGFDRQRESVEKYAARQGLTIVQEFRDEGVSGTNELADRPGLSALVDRLESNGVRTVLVETASRLARDLMISEVILARFRSAGVQVIEADSGTDLTVSDGNPTAKLIRQILGAVAEFDRAVTVAKLAGARARIRRETGRCEGKKPYGELPGEAEIVAKIKALRRKTKGGDRLSYAAVAEALNTQGVPTRQGGQWRASTVQNVCKR